MGDLQVCSIWCFGCGLLGIILLSIYVPRHQDNEDDHNDDYAFAQGTITEVSKNPYVCYAQVNCNKCSDGSGYPYCQNLINNKQTGTCHRSGGPCCRRSCITTKCADSLCQNCHCAKRYNKQRCQVIKGTCYKPYIKVQYTHPNTAERIIGRQMISCHINQHWCADYFVKDRIIGEDVNIHYKIDDPTQIYLDEQPTYDMKTSHKTAIVFGSIFAFISFGLMCFILYDLGVSKNAYSIQKHDRNAYRT
jgi:hypothetical protein